MKKKRLLLAIIISVLGLIGVLSLLTMKVNLPEEIYQLLKKDFTDDQIKYLVLVNPAIMVFIATIIGTLLYHRTNLSVPILERLVRINSNLRILELIKPAVIMGIAGGFVLLLADIIIHKLVPLEMLDLNNSIEPSIGMRLLYGGITEEILLRFGFMTFIVWLLLFLFKNSSQTPYWIGIIITAILFGLGHLPVVYQSISDPSQYLIIHVILTNSMVGIIYGWLYWKKGLEASIIAHAFTHITVLLIA